MANHKNHGVEYMFGNLDKIISQEPEPVRAAFRYGLGVLLVERGAATPIEENEARLVIEDTHGESVTLPRPDELSPSQEEMVKGHLSWLLQSDLP